MASVQQTVYRIAPESVKLSVDKLESGVAQPALSNSAAGTAGTANAVIAAMPVTASTAASTTVSAESGAASPADTALLSDRKKADNFLERRKQELMGMFQSHQGASAIAAEQQQWFVYAKSIVLLGLGMTFWGVLFRSMRMLHGSTAVGVLGLLLTANGYWLFFRF